MCLTPIFQQHKPDKHTWPLMAKRMNGYNLICQIWGKMVNLTITNEYYISI